MTNVQQEIRDGEERMAITDNEFWKQLGQLIELPPEVISLDLHVAVNEAATMTVKSYIVPHVMVDGWGEPDTLAQETKRYTLTEIEDE